MTAPTPPTKGPWHVNPSIGENGPSIIIRDSKETEVATVNADRWDRPTWQANARLIASAPETRDRLEEAETLLERWVAWYRSPSPRSPLTLMDSEAFLASRRKEV